MNATINATTAVLSVVVPSTMTLSSTSVDPSSTADSSDPSGGGLLGIAAGLLVLACMCWMLKPRPVDVESSWLRRLAREKEPEESPEERQARIDAALAIQVVTATDADGSLRLGPEETTPSSPTEENLLQVLSSGAGSTVQPIETTADEEDTTACCCICLEPYEVGEEVAWNKRQLDKCQHVFHKDCILGWLERHNDCPSCRVPIVVDADKAMEDDSENSAFAIVHGLLSRVAKTFKPKSKRKPQVEKPEIFRRVTSLGTCQTWERLPSQDSNDELGCTARAQMIRRVVSDGLSTPSTSRRKEYFNLARDTEESECDVDSQCDVELGHLQVLRHSVSFEKDILENVDHDEDLSEEDEIIFKIL